jgi:hypothetical protein
MSSSLTCAELGTYATTEEIKGNVAQLFVEQKTCQISCTNAAVM